MVKVPVVRVSIVAALSMLALTAFAIGACRAQPAPTNADASEAAGGLASPAPSAQPLKLIFIHHSTGEAWLADGDGDLGIALRDNNYFVSDTNYGWGPADADVGYDTIGDHTDIGNWYNWFAGPHRATYLNALYSESGQYSSYSRVDDDPGGSNQIIMFKSCFPNSNLGGGPNDPPATGNNPLRGQDASSEFHTVGNAKGIYNDILAYFATRQDKLFIAITAPPLVSAATDAASAANARAFNNWLVNDWLAGYPYNNVAVFDFYNVLTSNGGNTNSNDLGWISGNHHRWWNGAIQHLQSVNSNFAAYGSSTDDSHPTSAGNQKATNEFVALLNAFYARWRAGQVTPTRTSVATLTRTQTGTASPSARTSTPTPTPTRTTSVTARRAYLPVATASYPPWPTATLTATSTPTSGSLGCSDAQPPFVTDFEVRQAPSLPEPPARVAWRDPVFGSCVARVTDRATDLAAGDSSAGLKNEYSRVQSFNADETLILVRGIEATWYLYNAATLQPLGQLPFGGSVDPRWDATNSNVLYYSEETRLMAYNVQSGAQTLMHDFASDFPGRSLSIVSTRYEGSPSRDGRYWGFMAQDQNYEAVALLVYDQQTNQVIAKRDIAGSPELDSVTISPLANYFVAYFDYCERGHMGSTASPCGLMVYDRNLTSGRGLLRLAGHSDLALDAQGHEVLVYQDIDTDDISMLDLATGTVTALWPIDFSYTPIGLHFSGRALNRPGWAVVSTHDEDVASHTWMDDQVFLIELKPNGRVVRLAHTHSLVDAAQEHDYWAEPQASANRDLTRVLFTSNWGRSGTGAVEMFMIELPPDWAATI